MFRNSYHSSRCPAFLRQHPPPAFLLWESSPRFGKLVRFFWYSSLFQTWISSLLSPSTFCFFPAFHRSPPPKPHISTFHLPLRFVDAAGLRLFSFSFSFLSFECTLLSLSQVKGQQLTWVLFPRDPVFSPPPKDLGGSSSCPSSLCLAFALCGISIFPLMDYSIFLSIDTMGFFPLFCYCLPPPVPVTGAPRQSVLDRSLNWPSFAFFFTSPEGHLCFGLSIPPFPPRLFSLDFFLRRRLLLCPRFGTLKFFSYIFGPPSLRSNERLFPPPVYPPSPPPDSLFTARLLPAFSHKIR